MNSASKVSFFCLSSGSESNCFFLGVEDCGILIDAGLGVRKTIQRLAENRISIDCIKAIFITHDHIDHIRAVSSLGERRGIPVYATKETIWGINDRDCINPKLESCAHYITKEEAMKVGVFEVIAFGLPHDACDSVGYTVKVLGKTFTFLTDLGHIPNTASKYIEKTNFLIIEANHDIHLLDNNPKYPDNLKERIRGDYGHLSNNQTAEYLAQNLTCNTSHIWLCHLSLENNTPEKAYMCIAEAIKERTQKLNSIVHLCVLKHGESSSTYEL